MQHILLLCQDNYLHGGPSITQSILPVKHLISKPNFEFSREISLLHVQSKGL